jgi:hypothetical protein
MCNKNSPRDNAERRPHLIKRFSGTHDTPAKKSRKTIEKISAEIVIG